MRDWHFGDLFPYRGGKITLVETKETPSPPGALASVRISGDRLLLPSSSVSLVQRLLFWCTRETEARLSPLLPAWSRELGVHPTSIVVQYAKTRWGSCSTAGRLLFNSRIAMLSDDVAEYLVVHELCHLKQMNHGPDFWREVEAALPDCRTRRRRLREQEKEAQL